MFTPIRASGVHTRLGVDKQQLKGLGIALPDVSVTFIAKGENATQSIIYYQGIKMHTIQRGTKDGGWTTFKNKIKIQYNQIS